MGSMNRPTRMCWTSQSGCTLDNALMPIDPVSVPFTDNPVEGRNIIGPFDDSIIHRIDRENYKIYNITEEGHSFHQEQGVQSLTVDTRLQLAMKHFLIGMLLMSMSGLGACDMNAKSQVPSHVAEFTMSTDDYPKLRVALDV